MGSFYLLLGVALNITIHHHEIIDHSAGENKTAELVYQAIVSIQASEIIETFGI